MKKLTSTMLIAVLIGTCLFSLFSCREEEEDLSSKIEKKIVAYQTDLKDSQGTLNSKEAVRNYLCNWAKAKGIDYTTDSHYNVILSVKSSKAYKDAPPTVVVCSYDPMQIENCLDAMATAMYIVKNNESTGKLNVIFTSEYGHDYSGISKLSSKYFKDNTNVFCLNGGSKNMWSFKTGGRSTYQFSSSVSYKKPEGNKAYRIKIEGLPGGIPDAKISSYPNPIKEIGDLLAYFKTNTLIYELANMHGGGSSSLYPKTATATVVINENDVDKFAARMETAIDNFKDDYLEDYPEATYTYEEVSLPDQVLKQEQLNEFVSLLYTLIDGVYARDKGDNLLSLTSIGTVKMEKGSYTISAVSNGLTFSTLTKIDNEYMTICGLADITYKKIGKEDPWSAPDDSPFASDVAAAFHDYCGKDMEFKDAVPSANTTYIQAKNKNCNMVNVSVNSDKVERYAGTIITFMVNQPHIETTD